MVWAVDMDDFRGICGPVNPLMTTIHNGLRDYRVTSKNYQTTPRVRQNIKITHLIDEYGPLVDSLARIGCNVIETCVVSPNGTDHPAPRLRKMTIKRDPRARNLDDLLPLLRHLKPRCRLPWSTRSMTTMLSATVRCSWPVKTAQWYVIMIFLHSCTRTSSWNVFSYVFFFLLSCKYYVCNHDKPIKRRCSPGLIYHTVKSICDWPANADREECRHVWWRRRDLALCSPFIQRLNLSTKKVL